MPSSCRRGYRLAVAGRSLRAAVKAVCLECVGWQRPEVTACSAVACPLWAMRPFQASEKANGGPLSSAGAAHGGTEGVGPGGAA